MGYLEQPYRALCFVGCHSFFSLPVSISLTGIPKAPDRVILCAMMCREATVAPLPTPSSEQSQVWCLKNYAKILSNTYSSYLERKWFKSKWLILVGSELHAERSQVLLLYHIHVTRTVCGRLQYLFLVKMAGVFCGANYL